MQINCISGWICVIQGFIEAVVCRLRSCVDEDVFIPLYPKKYVYLCQLNVLKVLCVKAFTFNFFVDSYPWKLFLYLICSIITPSLFTNWIWLVIDGCFRCFCIFVNKHLFYGLTIFSLSVKVFRRQIISSASVQRWAVQDSCKSTSNSLNLFKSLL